MDLTILLVTRERPILLEHSIRSILASAQAAAPDVLTRVRVIDDSDGGSAEPVARSLGVDYERNPIRVAGNGLSAARAWAIPRVSSDLVAMFDDDDLMLEDHIGRLAGHIREGADVCATGYWYADANPDDITQLVPRPQPARPRQPKLGDLLAGFQPVNDGAMMRTSVAQSITWDPDREILMMYHVWLQLLLAGYKFVVNPSPTFLYRQHSASMSHNLGSHEAGLRANLIAEFRARARERYGYVPGPSPALRLRLLRQAIGNLAGRAWRLPARDRD
jgi:succinoglycan biosynthesis protein ExoO